MNLINFFKQTVFRIYIKTPNSLLWERIGLDTRLNARKRVANRYLQGEGIEIGALHNPLPLKKNVHVRYVDRLPLSELQKQYPELDPHRMVSLDTVDDGETLSTITDDSLDFIIANHFLEHCENPIGTIRNHLKKVKTMGILFYIIPEKTCTFDKERELTEFNHLVDEDVIGTEISRNDHFHEYVKSVDKNQDQSDTDAQVSALISKGYSIHFHVWNTATLFQFFYKTNEYLDNPFTVIHFERNDAEVIVVLQKSKI